MLPGDFLDIIITISQSLIDYIISTLWKESSMEDVILAKSKQLFNIVGKLQETITLQYSTSLPSG